MSNAKIILTFLVALAPDHIAPKKSWCQKGLLFWAKAIIIYLRLLVLLLGELLLL